MDIYEIINPSDAYTLVSDSFEFACIVACLLGEGKYGLWQIDGDNEMPIFFIGGHDVWFTEHFGADFSAVMDRMNPAAVADVCDSVLIGKACDRETFDKAMALIEDESKRQEFRAHWHNTRRSSMNDIGSRARFYAEKLRVVAAQAEVTV